MIRTLLSRIWHVLDADEIGEPRRGVILRHFDGRLDSVVLALSIRGLRCRLHMEDYANAIFYGPSEAYLHIYMDRHRGRWSWPRVHAGIAADPTAKRGEPRRIRMYRCIP